MKSPLSLALFCCVGLSAATTAQAQTVVKPANSDDALTSIKMRVTLPERRTKIYVGSSDEGGLPTAWEELANPDNYSKWDYVRAHADGFYTNFAMMDHVFAHGASPLQMSRDMANAFTHKFAFYETDMNYPAAQDLRNIECLTAGGFVIPVTSLNYGISAERVRMIKTYKGARECLTLMGPWTLGGTLLGKGAENTKVRANIKATDGMSADSPLRLWYNDENLTREGLYSTVIFANQLGKTSSVMLAPPDSNDRPGYLGPSFLKSSQMMVFDLEDHQAVPAIWGVYPYGAQRGLATFPESVANEAGDTVAPDTKTGVAYWLIKHFNTLPKIALLNNELAKTGAQVVQTRPDQASVTLDTARNGAVAYALPLVISNGLAPGIAISPVVRATISDGEGWDIQFKLRGQSVTEAMVYQGGFNFVGDARIFKDNPATLELSIRAKKRGLKPVTIQLQTMSNSSNTVNKAVGFSVIAKTR